MSSVIFPLVGFLMSPLHFSHLSKISVTTAGYSYIAGLISLLYEVMDNVPGLTSIVSLVLFNTLNLRFSLKIGFFLRKHYYNKKKAFFKIP